MALFPKAGIWARSSQVGKAGRAWHCLPRVGMVFLSGQEQRSKTCLVRGERRGADDIIPRGQPTVRHGLARRASQASGTLQEAGGGFEKPIWVVRQALEACGGVSRRQTTEWLGRGEERGPRSPKLSDIPKLLPTRAPALNIDVTQNSERTSACS